MNNTFETVEEFDIEFINGELTYAGGPLLIEADTQMEIRLICDGNTFAEIVKALLPFRDQGQAFMDWQTKEAADSDAIDMVFRIFDDGYASGSGEAHTGTPHADGELL